MKQSSHAPVLLVFLLLSPVFAWASAQAEAASGTDAFDACVQCHGDAPDYSLRGAVLEYENSGHATLGNSHYANGTGCQQCHTNEGFIEYVETGTVEGFVDNPSQPGCFTCHTPHTTFDFSLRTVQPVQLANGTTYDGGAGNLCVNCHSARSDAQAAVEPMPASAVMAHFGAHHGPQGDVFAGTNAYEFPGRDYSSSGHQDIIRDSCAICHMSLPDGRYGLSPAIGGHSFNIVGEVHEAATVNASACVSCHADAAAVPGTETFNIMAKLDFDLDGVVEPVQEEVDGLLLALVSPDGSGALQALDPPFYTSDGAWNAVRSDVVRSETEIAALYNYKMMLEDRSRGVHNATYTIQILYDTIKALDPTFDDSLRPE